MSSIHHEGKTEKVTYSKSSKREKDLLKIQQEREGGIQKPAREKEDVLKIQQERD